MYSLFLKSYQNSDSALYAKNLIKVLKTWNWACFQTKKTQSKTVNLLTRQYLVLLLCRYLKIQNESSLESYWNVVQEHVQETIEDKFLVEQYLEASELKVLPEASDCLELLWEPWSSSFGRAANSRLVLPVSKRCVTNPQNSKNKYGLHCDFTYNDYC